MDSSPTYPACLYPAPPPPVPVHLIVIDEQTCPYLPGRSSRSRAFAASAFSGETYHRFMNAGFRRSGEVFYQPICLGCRACMPIRVPTGSFRPSKSQRRCRRRNEDMVVTIGQPACTDEKFALYGRYIARRHHATGAESREAFEGFLYRSPVNTVEICCRDGGGNLLGVGICDVCSQSLSSVYFYFEPEASDRGLGTFGALVEIDLAGRSGIPFYYLGYWVGECRAMRYKSAFRPCQVLHPDGQWREMGAGG